MSAAIVTGLSFYVRVEVDPADGETVLRRVETPRGELVDVTGEELERGIAKGWLAPVDASAAEMPPVSVAESVRGKRGRKAAAARVAGSAGGAESDAETVEAVSAAAPDDSPADGD